MKHSTDRILTSHAGSLPRPDDLLALYKSAAPSEDLEPRLQSAVAEIVAKQADVGIDVVNDGEYGKPMSEEVDYFAWATYAYGRMSGFELRPLASTEGLTVAVGADQRDFKEFYAATQAEMSSPDVEPMRSVNVGPIAYTGQALVQRDIDNLKAALAGSSAIEGFMTAVSPDAQAFMLGEYYTSPEEQAVAGAQALREEYKMITDAELNLQIDDPILVNQFESQFSQNWDIPGFRKWAEGHIELLNHALEGIPAEQVRYHMCWGSQKSPHSSDLPLEDVIDLMLTVNASQYAVEAANVRHEHEWKVWKDTKLPDSKTLVPGVVTHKTNVLEHPELVADRIVRYADAVGRENVLAGTDCGMGGRIHPQLVWAKLRVLSEGAALASQRLWS